MCPALRNKILHVSQATVCTVVLCTSALLAASSDKLTSEIISNDIRGLAGNGDTLWMATLDDQYRFGLNYTLNLGQAWWGYRIDTAIAAFAFGNRYALVALDTSEYAKPNALWYYNHSASAFGRITIGWPQKPGDDTTTHYYVRDIVCPSGSFWMACTDGGLMRWSATKDSIRIFYPDTAASPPVYMPDEVSSVAPDTLPEQRQLRVEAVDAEKRRADSLVLWVVTPARIWTFSPRDTLWDTTSTSLSGASLGSATFFDVYVGEFGSDMVVLCRAETRSSVDDADTAYFRYDPATRGWSKVFDNTFHAVTFGEDRSVYTVRSDFKVEKYSIDSLSKNPVISEEQFRMRGPAEINWPDYVFDIAFLGQPGDSDALWLATGNGLLMSPRELVEEKNNAGFTHLKRSPSVKAGLEESYAYPGILTPDQEKTIFAFNLSKDSPVTIRIYDWNMDLVRTVIKGEKRFAGKNRPAGIGRSTDEKFDYWDGTDERGRKVAVGVYYYKINADSGERSFGKIIVAR